jgi:hypothetical protein
MSPELRERIIEVLEAVLFDGGCIICGKAGHTPDCKLIACLESLKAQRTTQRPDMAVLGQPCTDCGKVPESYTVDGLCLSCEVGGG